MRRVAPLLPLLLLPLPALAATLPVQGALRTQAGGPATDGTYLMALRLYDAADAQVFVFQDLLDVPVAQGVFAATLGLLPPAPLADELLLGGKPLWLGVKVGSDPELPRVPLGRVAGAWHAARAGDLDCSGCVGPADLADGSVTPQKVAFAYAGADAKGGAALLAKAADTAKVADSAKNADHAATADELACTGCVGLKHLGATAVAAFVASQDGVAKGTLTVDGTLALGGSTITGGRFAAIDVAKAPCTAAQLGQVALDAGKRLRFCDGGKWRRISTCDGVCKQPAEVACGAAIVDDCGDASACSGTGALCPAGATCQASVCKAPPGADPATAGISCQALLGAGVVADGAYWLDPDGPGGSPAFQAFCDMTTAGGGWTRCGWIDEVAANDGNLVVVEGPAFVDLAKLKNASFCGHWYKTQKPVEMLVHNLTAGTDYGQGHKLRIRWGDKPFTYGKYDNHAIEKCENLTTGKVWSGCLYAAHDGWEDTAFSFTVGGLQSGYGGNADRRLILGPTAQAGGNKQWHNFGADSNAQNTANAWVGGMNVGYLYLR